MKRLLALTFLALSSLSCAMADTVSTKASVNDTANPASVALPAVAAHYVIATGPQKADWFLIRESQQIQTYNPTLQRGEIWLRDTKGRIEHQQVFSADHKIVEYTQGQLLTLHRLPQWQQLATLISPQEFAALKKTGERDVNGKLAWVMQGTVRGEASTVWWLPELQLPARIVTHDAEHQMVIELQDHQLSKPASWNWMDDTELANYDRIDGSDLGDLESDPFVQKLLAQEGHSHHH